MFPETIYFLKRAASFIGGTVSCTYTTIKRKLFCCRTVVAYQLRPMCISTFPMYTYTYHMCLVPRRKKLYTHIPVRVSIDVLTTLTTTSYGNVTFRKLHPSRVTYYNIAYFVHVCIDRSPGKDFLFLNSKIFVYRFLKHNVYSIGASYLSCEVQCIVESKRTKHKELKISSTGGGY